MTVEELGYKCKEIEVDCDKCAYRSECGRLAEKLEDISPCGLLSILKEELN